MQLLRFQAKPSGTGARATESSQAIDSACSRCRGSGVGEAVERVADHRSRDRPAWPESGGAHPCAFRLDRALPAGAQRLMRTARVSAADTTRTCSPPLSRAHLSLARRTRRGPHIVCERVSHGTRPAPAPALLGARKHQHPQFGSSRCDSRTQALHPRNLGKARVERVQRGVSLACDSGWSADWRACRSPPRPIFATITRSRLAFARAGPRGARIEHLDLVAGPAGAHSRGATMRIRSCDNGLRANPRDTPSRRAHLIEARADVALGYGMLRLGSIAADDRKRGAAMLNCEEAETCRSSSVWSFGGGARGGRPSTTWACLTRRTGAASARW